VLVSFHYGSQSRGLSNVIKIVKLFYITTYYGTPLPSRQTAKTYFRLKNLFLPKGGGRYHNAALCNIAMRNSIPLCLGEAQLYNGCM